MPSLYGVIEKRNWAEHHLKLIEAMTADFFGSNPYPVITDSHPEDGVYHARLVYPKKLSVRQLVLMIGDCVHNMRSALDYIAWELAGADLRDKTTMFPIYDSEVEFIKLGRKRIKNLPEDARTLIERMQPYDRRYGGAQLALSAINNLDNADKHKLLTVAIVIAEGINCDHGIPGHIHGKFERTMDLFTGFGLKHDAIVGTFTISPPIPEMQVNFKLTPQIEFGERHGFGRHPFVVPNLKLMLKSVDNVIRRFSHFFTNSSYTEKG